jgi:hypothetical protein
MQGVLTQMRTPISADRLEPFAEPGVWFARLPVQGVVHEPTAIVYHHRSFRPRAAAAT